MKQKRRHFRKFLICCVKQRGTVPTPTVSRAVVLVYGRGVRMRSGVCLVDGTVPKPFFGSATPLHYEVVLGYQYR